MRGLVHHGLGIFAALCCLASTCDNQDFSKRFVLTVPTDGEPAVRAYRQPYIGRITLDFGLLNTGATNADYEISVQAQTTGETDATACENATTIPRFLEGVAIDGDVSEGTVPLIRTFDRLHEISLLPDGDSFAALVDLRIRTASTYRLYRASPSTTIALFADEIELPIASAQPELDTCDALQSATSYALDEGTFRMAIRSDSGVASVLVEEACESVRTVPATCPGAASELHVRDPLTLSPGSFISGRVSSLDLGVGDQAVVALDCTPADDCVGELELFFLVEQLECRTDSDCRAREACSSDAYCVPTDSRGCSAAAGAQVGWFGLFALIALTRRRR